MANPDSDSFTILVTVVAGLCSLLGAFAGAALSRRSDRIKWLRQNQSEVFAEFLEKLQEARHRSIQAKVEFSDDESKRTWAILNAFASAMRHERVVRLYLKQENRDRFSKLVQNFWKTSSKDAEGPSTGESGVYLQAIQEIFEGELQG